MAAEVPWCTSPPGTGSQPATGKGNSMCTVAEDGRTPGTQPQEATTGNPSIPEFPAKGALSYPSVCLGCPSVSLWNDGVGIAGQSRAAQPNELKISFSAEDAVKQGVEIKASFPKAEIKASWPKEGSGVGGKPTMEPDEFNAPFPKEGVGDGKKPLSELSEFKSPFSQKGVCVGKMSTYESDEVKTSVKERCCFGKKLILRGLYKYDSSAFPSSAFDESPDLE
eukprot:CAMPEP_0115249196 /NCGR_PEP_ID=MMETSP0270-20121206/42466_1 /TAXON_ID=71861 /ORGANISM="Scrippsiella trochoidea, Strain CCMP3099" /LENGTH=222 /DNA_ID=CAMNT_0002664531 /DNA_START=634 /DNA_END=1302 /DNA_ORIENTATION=-